MRVLPALFLLASSAAIPAESVFLDVIADASFTPRAKLTQGRDTTIVARDLALRLRTSLAPRWKAHRATLLLHVTSKPPKRIEASALGAGPWSDEDEKFMHHPRIEEWTHVRSQPERDGWLVIFLPPQLVNQILADPGHSLALRFNPAITIDSRESGHFAPRFLIEQ